MNKADLVHKIATEAELTNAKADAALNAIMEGVKESLKNGEKVTLVGFGTFSVSERKARNGIHPQTGKKINIPASKTVKFTVGKEFKEIVNK
jgi:DNA-binding protein HU-beta